MPSIREVEHYLTGLWLLLRNNPKGLTYLDLSDRGVLRSFWAIVWSAPSILISWIWWRKTYLNGMPEGAEAGPVFYLRLAMIEAANWIVPLILVGLLCLMLRIGARFSVIVVASNWLAVPVSYAYAVLIVAMMLVPALANIVALLWFVVLFVVVNAVFRILRTICGNQLLTVGALTMVLLVPAMIFSEVLERYLGVFPN